MSIAYKSLSPTILVINFHSSCNSGDLATLELTVQQLRASFANPRIIIAANYPNEKYLATLGIEVVPSPSVLIGTSDGKPYLIQLISMATLILTGLMLSFYPHMPPRKLLIPKNWQNMLRAYQEADMVVSVPGTIFFTMGMIGWPFIVASLSIALADFLKKPLYIMPQSIGPFKQWWQRLIFSKLFGHARIVFVRNHASLKLVRELGLSRQRTQYIPDLAFDLPLPLSKDFALNVLKSFGDMTSGGKIGVTVINQLMRSFKEENFDRYYSAMAQQLTRLVQKHNSGIYFFPHVTGPTPRENDMAIAEKISEQMANVKHNVFLVYDQCSPSQLKAMYGLMDIFVATRMHSGIFALSMGVPTLFIGYLTKTHDLLESLGMEEWLVEIDELDSSHLGEKIESLWLHRDEIRQTLLKMMPDLIAQIRQVGLLIAQDYSHGSK